jgi:AraC family transcriptional regulator of adaptative response / DNA-3-methyladenine glycosylase II
MANARHPINLVPASGSPDSDIIATAASFQATQAARLRSIEIESALSPVVPAKTGTQGLFHWTPAFAGMTGERAGFNPIRSGSGCHCTMTLQFAECDRARIARDARYDGRFFTAVRTTKIYCRPVCPAQPRSDNVCYFPSAAAAELAGFRPCLRCRPETAPFSPAWKGTRATVDRALRLIIDEGALDAENARVENLAARLGVGARQLSRLFARHLNATPVQVAKTARVQRAKRLLDSTELPMTEIAMRAGFRSLRRFNAVFIEVYRRSPTSIKRSARSLPT